MHLLEKKRAAITEEMNSLVALAKAERRDLTFDEQEQTDRLMEEHQAVVKRIALQNIIDEEARRATGHVLSGRGDTFDQEVRSYSLLKALAAAAGIQGVDAGRENEISQELARRSGRTPQGIFAPMEIFQERRDLLSTTTPAAGPGSNLVPTDHLSGHYFDRLRANSVIASKGATIISNLHGNVEIPGMVTSANTFWVDENEAITESAPTFRQIPLKPKHAGALAQLTRNMLQQTSPDAESLVRNDFARILAEAVDRVAIQGGGTNEPSGILATSGISQAAYNPAKPWECLQDFMGELEDRNVSLATCSFATNPGVVTYLRQTPRTPETFIMENRNMLDGYPVTRSTLMPAETMIFGDWQHLIIGYWSAFDLLVNPFAEGPFSKGNILIRAMLTCDLAIRHKEAFSVLTGVKGA